MTAPDSAGATTATAAGGRPALGLQRQALHAWRLVLPHPVHDTEVSVSCEPPPDFATGWLAVAGRMPLEC